MLMLRTIIDWDFKKLAFRRCVSQTWKLFLWVPQTQFWPVTGSSRAGAIFQAKSNIKPLPTPKTIDLKCYLIPFCSNSDFWMQNQTIFGPFCLKKSDFRPKSEKIGSLGTASVWFLTSALMVPQACLWCLRLFLTLVVLRLSWGCDNK